MTKEATATKTAPAPKAGPKPVEEILEPFAGQIIPAAKLGKALRDGGHEPAEAVAALRKSGAVQQLGNSASNDDGVPVGFRFAVPKVEPGGKVWVRAQHGPAVKIPGLGTFTAFGRAVEVSAKDLAFLRSRDVPAEVISDAGKVAKLEAEAKRREEAKARVIDKGAAVAAELG